MGQVLQARAVRGKMDRDRQGGLDKGCPCPLHSVFKGTQRTSLLGNGSYSNINTLALLNKSQQHRPSQAE